MPVTFTSRVLGEVEVGDDALLAMPDGLFGFPACTSFAMLPAGRDGFFWLHSVREPTIDFLIVDPFKYFDGYSVDIAEPILQRLETTLPSDVNVFAIVTLPSGADDATANLQGPLVFNVATRMGFQAVIQDTEFSTRERLPRQVRVTT
ncbi:MAG: flagellar assembly protein FliW [bacterium]